MKAAICRGFNQPLSIEEVTLTAPDTGEVQVRLAASAICHSDITYMDGGWGGALPQVFGHEASGVITALGPGVRGLQKGDRVLVTLIRSCGHCAPCEQAAPYLCESEFPLDQSSPITDSDGLSVQQGLRTGAFAEEVVVDQSQVVTIPNSVPFDAAALLSCGVITGLGAVVNTANVPYGASVVVIGCGGVGLNSIQGAALVGAYPIIAVDLVDAKLEVAPDFGASHVINGKAEDAIAKVHELTGGGADYVFVAAGSPAAFEQGLEMLAPAGTMTLVGMPPTGEKVGVEVGNVAGSAQNILGSKMGSARLRVDIPKLVKLYEQGRIKLDELISGRYGLDQINEAIDEVRTDKALRNVIILDETL